MEDDFQTSSLNPLVVGDAVAEMREKPPDKQAQGCGDQGFSLGHGKFEYLLIHPRCHGQVGFKAQRRWEERSGLQVDFGPSRVAEAGEGGGSWAWAHRDLFLLSIPIVPLRGQVLLLRYCSLALPYSPR